MDAAKSILSAWSFLTIFGIDVSWMYLADGLKAGFFWRMECTSCDKSSEYILGMSLYSH